MAAVTSRSDFGAQNWSSNDDHTENKVYEILPLGVETYLPLTQQNASWMLN